MREAGPNRRRRWWLVAVAGVVLAVVAVIALRTLVFRDRARVVSTEEAVDRFRTQASSVPVESTSAATTVAVLAPPTMPAARPTAPTSSASTFLTTTSSTPSAPVALVAPGVYRYATTGQEQVDALDGRPGVMSARLGGPAMSDAAKCRAVLKGLVDVPDAARTARFRCVLAVARGGRTVATFEGAVEGTILREMRGAGGFGYDPIFLHPPSGKTFAELTVEEKERVSHRGKAIERLKGTGTFF